MIRSDVFLESTYANDPRDRDERPLPAAPKPRKRVILIGCGKTKLATADKAWRLYTGNLFKARFNYAQNTACARFILSAKYGVIALDATIEPYDVTIDQVTDKPAWARLAVAQLLLRLRDLRYNPKEVVLEIHASADYIEALRPHAEVYGLKVTAPMHGLAIGKQLQFYAR